MTSGGIFRKKKGIIAAATVAILVCIFIGLVTRGSSKDTLIYLKDNELVCYTKKDNIVLCDAVYEDSDEIYGPYDEYNANYVNVTKDGKYVFYPQNLSWENFDLYYKEVNGAKAAGNKVASDVSHYMLLQNNKVVYLENLDNELYITDLKNKEMIASGVGQASQYLVSDDEKYVLWVSFDDYKLYMRDLTLENDKIEIDSDICSINSLVYTSDDFRKIVYIKDEELYCVMNFEEKEKVGSHVTDVQIVQSDSETEIYYMADKEDVVLSEFIEDDYAFQDANMQEPDIADYQSLGAVSESDGTSEKVVTDDAYFIEKNKYNEKVKRDFIREYMDKQVAAETYTLYRYIVGEKTAEEYATGMIWNCYPSDTLEPVLVYSELIPENVKKTKISEIMDLKGYNEKKDEVWKNTIDGAIKTYMVYNGEKVELDIDLSKYTFDFFLCAIDKKNKECYFQVLENCEDYNRYLFKTSYRKMDGKMELICDRFRAIEAVSDEGVYYSVQSGEEYASNLSLYLNGQVVDADVRSYSGKLVGNGKKIVYMTDWDEKEQKGTLRFATGTDSIWIADDVSYFASDDDGNIAFLEDYNFDEYRGDLKIFRNNKIMLIDNDVKFILNY